MPNFGIQEWMELEPLYELFPNAPRAHAGYVLAACRSWPRPRVRRGGGAQASIRDARLPQRYWPDGSVGDY